MPTVIMLSGKNGSIEISQNEMNTAKKRKLPKQYYSSRGNRLNHAFLPHFLPHFQILLARKNQTHLKMLSLQMQTSLALPSTTPTLI